MSETATATSESRRYTEEQNAELIELGEKMVGYLQSGRTNPSKFFCPDQAPYLADFLRAMGYTTDGDQLRRLLSNPRRRSNVRVRQALRSREIPKAREPNVTRLRHSLKRIMEQVSQRLGSRGGEQFEMVMIPSSWKPATKQKFVEKLHALVGVDRQGPRGTITLNTRGYLPLADGEQLYNLADCRVTIVAPNGEDITARFDNSVAHY